MKGKTKSKTMLTALLLAGIAIGASAVDYVYLADGIVAGPTDPTYQPFSNTINGQFHNGDIISGNTTLADALTYSARPAGNGTSPGHDNGRFEPGLIVPGSNTVIHAFSSPLELSGMLLWNYNEYWDGLANDRGVTRADITIVHAGGTNIVEDAYIDLTPSDDGENQLSIAQQLDFGATYAGVTSIILSDLERGGTAHMGWKDTAFISPSGIPPTPPVWDDPIVVEEAIVGIEYADTLADKASDINGDPITYSRDASGPAWLIVDTDGAMSGTPSVTGTVSFLVIATAEGDSTTGTLHIAVRDTLPPVWNVPVPIDGGSVFVNGEYNGSLDGAASDPDGETITYTKTGGPAWLIVDADGTMSGPAPATAGTNTFTVSADDGIDTAITADLNVVVLASETLARTISINFIENDSNQGFAGGQPIGPLETDSANWNNTKDRETGTLATGTMTDLKDDTGSATTADISWASANVWYQTDGTADDEHKISVGYLDDGAGGPLVTITDIPYASYRVYGLFSSGQAGNDAMVGLDFDVNGTWAYGGASAANTPANGTITGNMTRNGEFWTEIVPGSVTGNYWTVETSGTTLVVDGQNRAVDLRGSIAGIIIEEISGGGGPGGQVMDLVIAGPVVGGMVLTWTGEDGKPYGVQTNSNLIIADWQSFMTGILGDGGTLSVTNPLGPDQTFYRVISE